MNEREENQEGGAGSRVPRDLEQGLAAGFGRAAPRDGPGPAASVLDRLASSAGVRARISLREEPSRNPSPLLKPRGPGPGVGGWPAVEGKYQVQGELARGGVGVVLKGHDVDLGRDVAMKVLHEKYVGDPDLVQRFVEEAQIGGQLQHPGIVPVYDLGLSGDRPYFTMKLIKGRTLAALFGEREDPDAGRRRLLGIFEQVCQTMAYAHARGVIHRDLKPANVMVGAFGEVQVVDWGMGKVLTAGGTADEERSRKNVQSVIETVRSQPGSGSTHSVVGSVMGTPAYMPPEQANGDVERMDERSDVFSLGAILCEILTGAPPYVGASDELITMAAKARLEPCKERIAASSADDELKELCTDCLLPVPAARPRDAGVLAERLARYLAGVEERARAAQIAVAEERAQARSARRAQRLTLALAVSVLATAILGAGGAWWIERQAGVRRAAAEVQVAAAMEHASALLGQALAVGGDSFLWDRADDAVGHAEQLTGSPDVPERRRAAAGAMRERFANGRADAERRADERARDEALMERVSRVRVPPDEGIRGDDWPRKDAERQDGEYGAAFAAFFGGRPVEEVEPHDAVARLKRSPHRVELAVALDHWALLYRAYLTDPGEPELRDLDRLRGIAREVDDADVWRADLRGLLRAPRANRDALLELAADVSLDELPALSLSLLAEALQAAGAEERAIEVYRRGSELHPSDFGIWMRLAILLWRVDPQPEEEIVDVLRIAHALRPEVREVQHLRAITLHALWRYEDELRVMEDLVRAEPKAHWYMHLLWPLKSLGMQEERIEAARGWLESIGPEPHDVSETTNATSALQHLAEGLEATGRYEEALAAFVRGRDYAAAYVRAVEAGAMERNEFVFHRRPELVEGVERMTAILRDRPELERILRGERVSDEGAEYVRAARVAGHLRRHGLAARTYVEAIARHPELVQDEDARKQALFAAARCASGQGSDSEPHDPAERRHCRQLALAWLRADFRAQESLEAEEPRMVQFRLRGWLHGRALAGLRDEAALANLPPEETAEWRELWAEIGARHEYLRILNADR